MRYVSVPPAILILAGATLSATALLLALFAFERTVAFRYLRRSGPWRGGHWAIASCLGAMGGGAALLVLGRGIWQVEALGAALFFVAAVAAFAVAVLRVFSLFTTIATLGISLGVAALVVVLAVTSGF